MTCHDEKNTFDQWLLLAALAHADDRARRFAEMFDGDPIETGAPGTVDAEPDARLESDYAALRRRSPLNERIDSIRKKYIPNQQAIARLIDTYNLLNLFAMISTFQDTSGVRGDAAPDFLNRLEDVVRLAARGLRHVRLIPGEEDMKPVILDAAIISRKKPPSDEKGGDGTASTGSERLSETPGKTGSLFSGKPRLTARADCLKKDDSGRYVLKVDPSMDRRVELEIGDSAIRIAMEGFPADESGSGGPDISVYFNGIDPSNRRQVIPAGENTCMVCHDFSHPELLNVTLIKGETPDSISLIFWSGIERDLIAGILEKVYPDPRQRLAWWWNGIEELDGLAPVQLIQKRREDRVLEYLSRRLDINHPSDGDR